MYYKQSKQERVAKRLDSWQHSPTTTMFEGGAEPLNIKSIHTYYICIYISKTVKWRSFCEPPSLIALARPLRSPKWQHKRRHFHCYSFQQASLSSCLRVLLVLRNIAMPDGRKCWRTCRRMAMPILEWPLLSVSPWWVPRGAFGWRALRSWELPSRLLAFDPRI